MTRLSESLVGDWVVFDRGGDTVDIEIPSTIGPAALLVSPMTDAVKRVDDEVVASLDRDQMWAVDAIVLNRVVLQRFEGEEFSVEDLLAAVREKGYAWQISPTSSP